MVGRTWPENLSSPRPRARPRPGRPSQPRKNPSSCHRASSPRQPGMTGSPLKWQAKNHKSGLRSRTARTRPRPYSPPFSPISDTRSNMSIGGSGNWALPAPNSSPRPQASRSSYSYVERRSSIGLGPCASLGMVMHRSPNTPPVGGKAAARPRQRQSHAVGGNRIVAKELHVAPLIAYDLIRNDLGQDDLQPERIRLA